MGGVDISDQNMLHYMRMEHVTLGNKVTILRWKNSNKFIMASNCCSIKPIENVKRWAKKT